MPSRRVVTANEIHIPDEPAGRAEGHVARRHPQLLGAEPPGQARSDSRLHDGDLAAGRSAGRLPRPVRGVLRHAARAHGARRRRRVRRGVRSVARRACGSRRAIRRARPARTGRDVFMQARCAGCHTIRGTDAAGQVAPDLTHIATRSTLGAGTLPNTPEHLAAWIRDPQRVKPGNQMPPNPLSPTTTCRRSSRTWRRCDDATATTCRATRRSRRARTDLGRSARASYGWFTHVDHKSIGRRYLVTAFAFFLLGGVLAALMRLQLSRPDNTVPRPGSLQPDLHHARHDDDVPVRRAGDAGARHLLRAADGRRAQHRVSAAGRLQLLDVPVRRHLSLRLVPAERRTGRRLVLLSAARRIALHAEQARRRLGAADHVHRGRVAGRRGLADHAPRSSCARPA